MEIQLDRALYRTIKQMDKAAMQSFLQDIYQSGKDETDGGSTAIDLAGLRTELSKVKGVGETRLNEIMAVIEAYSKTQSTAQNAAE